MGRQYREGSGPPPAGPPPPNLNTFAPSPSSLPFQAVSGRVCVPLGLQDIVNPMGDGRLAKTDADSKEFVQFGVREVRVTLPNVFDRFVHPLPLILSVGLEDTAAVDVAEEFIACSFS